MRDFTVLAVGVMGDDRVYGKLTPASITWANGSDIRYRLHHYSSRCYVNQLYDCGTL